MESAEWLVWEREWDREGEREREWARERWREKERGWGKRGVRDVECEKNDLTFEPSIMKDHPDSCCKLVTHVLTCWEWREREREIERGDAAHSFLLAIPQRGCEWSEVKFNWMSATSNPNDAYLSFCLFKIITFLFWTEEIQVIFCSSQL